MKKLRLTILSIGLGLYASPSSAQIFKLQFNPAAGVNDSAVALINAEVQKIQTDINKDLPGSSTPDRLMEGMANSSVIAGKGIGTDYASGMKYFIVGAGLGAGVDMTKNKDADSDLSGAGVQPGIMIGTNLGWMDTQKILGLETDRLNVFFNFMSYSMDHKTGDTDAEIKMQAIGSHISYDWVKGSGSKLFGWGGIKITTGFEHNSTKLGFKSKINKVMDYSNSDFGAPINFHADIIANPFAEIDVKTTTIPLNISSSVQILYLLSLYGGLGLDYSTGKATGKGDLNSTPATVSCTPSNPAACPSGTAGTINTSANIDGSGKVEALMYRAFAGVQINLPFTRIFVQADKSLGNNLVGATAGVRFVY